MDELRKLSPSVESKDGRVQLRLSDRESIPL